MKTPPLWTSEELSQAALWKSEGVSLRQIAERLNQTFHDNLPVRSRGSVEHKLRPSAKASSDLPTKAPRRLVAEVDVFQGGKGLPGDVQIVVPGSSHKSWKLASDALRAALKGTRETVPDGPTYRDNEGYRATLTVYGHDSKWDAAQAAQAILEAGGCRVVVTGDR